jgi:hypothetical protein
LRDLDFSPRHQPTEYMQGGNLESNRQVVKGRVAAL